MSLGSCRQCGAQVSPRAEACPQCGEPKPVDTGSGCCGVLGALFVIFMLVVIFFALFGDTFSR